MSNQETIVTLENHLQQELPAKLDYLQQTVNINSFTANPIGVNKVGDLTAEAFAQLGFTAERVQAADYLYGKHLILTRHGQTKDGRPGPKVGFISHLDTVYPAAEELDNNFHWRISGRRIYGPGVYDIKGGTMMILLLLSALQKVYPELFDQITWVVLLNAAEEALVPDFGRLCLSNLDGNTLAALVFEGGVSYGKDYKFVTSRKGMARYHITVEGKAAHAGTSHNHGANAILQMSEVIQRVAHFTNYEQAITFNVGTISGGTVINRVPHQASAFVEMRAYSPSVFASGVDRMVALNEFSSVQSANGGYPCKVSINLLGQWKPWAPNQKSDTLLNLWREAGKNLGIVIEGEARGGLSDGNWTWQQVATLDGLGPDGGNAHCSERSEDGSKDQEYILLDSFIPKALLNCLAITKLVNEHAAIQSNGA